MRRLLFKALLLSSLFGLLASVAAQAQARLNLRLEPAANQHRPLLLWSGYLPPGGQFGLDSTVAHQGQGSLHVVLPTRGEAGRYTAVGVALPPDSLRGQLVTVSAWVRTRSWRGQAGLTASATTLTQAGLSSELASALDSLPANQDWRRLELRFPVKAAAFSCYVGLQTKGSGHLWLDDVELRVQGRLLPELPVPATEALLLPPTQVLALNWDFERPLPALVRPDPALATAAPDSASPQHGRRYLHVARRSPAGAAPTAYLGSLRLNPRDSGKILRVLGYWRWVGGSGAAPAFKARLLRTSLRPGSRWYPDTLTTRTPPPPGPAWSSFAFEVPIQLLLPGTNAEADTTSLGACSLSLQLPGAGTVDIDNLTFAIDGRPYAPTGPPTFPLPTAAEVAWLRTVAQPLRLAAPATDFQDLAPLAKLLAPAQLVGLGEVTRGSHEVVSLNARLVRYLLGQRGFTSLLLEASPAGCARLNEYLRGSPGNPAALLTALGENWATTETLELVGWLRAYNQAHPTAPVQVAGLDVRQPEQALAYLRQQLLDADDNFAQSRLQQLSQLLAAYPHPAPDDPDLRQRPDQPQDSLLGPVHRLLAELQAGLAARATIGGQPTSLARLEAVQFYLRLLAQGATWRRLSFNVAFNYRQACLAENARYFSQASSTAGSVPRVIIWASNRSVARALSKEERPMGQWLAATYGTGYAALGVALGQGRFAAAALPSPAALATAPAGAYEAWLRTGPAAYWLPLSHPPELTTANAWLSQSQLLRDIGYANTRNQFMLHNLRQEFDALLFVRESTAVQLVP